MNVMIENWAGNPFIYQRENLKCADHCQEQFKGWRVAPFSPFCSRCSFKTSFFFSPPSALPVPVRRRPRNPETRSCSMCRPPPPLPRGLDPPYVLLRRPLLWERVESGRGERSTFLTLTRTTHQRLNRLL